MHRHVLVLCMHVPFEDADHTQTLAIPNCLGPALPARCTLSSGEKHMLQTNAGAGQMGSRNKGPVENRCKQQRSLGWREVAARIGSK